MARRIAIRIYERITALIRAPHAGRKGRLEDTRELVISGLPFQVIYRVRADVIEVDRILHGAQQWPV